MTKTLIRALAAVTFAIATPVFAQDADHSAHHLDGAGSAAEAPAAPVETPATMPDGEAMPAAPGTAGNPGMAGMPGGMDCMKMMQSMMGGGMPMMGAPGAGGMAMPGGALPMAAPAAPSTTAYRIANERMHAGMAINYSGDADADFVRGMIAHHRGAIEMAEAVLEYGKDPEIRKLAEGVIAAQEAEVATMGKWLLDHKGAAQ